MKAIKDFFDLTIGPEYVPSWSNWEAIREFIQNALDGIDDGFPMMIHRGSNGTIVIKNQGAVLKPEHLILGRTSKAGGSYRGQYGEGFKLGMMALCRQAKENNLEHALFIHTGNETWVPTIHFSTKYNTDIIRVNVYNRVDDGHLIVEIPNIDLPKWLEFQDRVLYFGLQQKHSSKFGEMLLDSKYAGNLFCKGLWVGKLPYTSTFGYNLSNLKLDRDRKMADIYDVRHEISSLLAELTLENKITSEQIMEFLDKEGTIEQQALINSHNYSNIFYEFQDKMAEYWTSLHGKDTVPVISDTEVSMCASIGTPYKTVSPSTAKFLKEINVPQFSSLKGKIALAVSKIYDEDELSSEELEIINKSKKLIQPLIDTYRLAKFTLEIVDFQSTSTEGSCDFTNNRVRISKNKITSMSKFLDIFIHELAHLSGNLDLTKGHIDEATAIAALIIENLLKDK